MGQVTQFALAFVLPALGIFVVRSRPHSPVNRAFAAQAMLFGGWVLGTIVGLSTLLTDLVAIHAPVAEENNIMIVLDAPGSTISVLGDRGQLIQLFPNLLNNAVKAMPQGVTVTTETVTVQVLGEGVGCPSSLRANLFQPFFTTKPQETGLGLSICRKIADFHWASLDLLPRADGRGTIARVVFFSNLHEAQNEAVSNPRPESIVAPANSRQRA